MTDQTERDVQALKWASLGAIILGALLSMGCASAPAARISDIRQVTKVGKQALRDALVFEQGVKPQEAARRANAAEEAVSVVVDAINAQRAAQEAQKASQAKPETPKEQK